MVKWKGTTGIERQGANYRTRKGEQGEEPMRTVRYIGRGFQRPERETVACFLNLTQMCMGSCYMTNRQIRLITVAGFLHGYSHVSV